MRKGLVFKMLSVALVLWVVPVYAAANKYPLEILFAPEGGIKSKLVNLIQNAQSSILIATYNIFLPDVTLSLVGAKSRGVQIRIILDDTGPTIEKSDFPLFQRNGIALLMSGGMSSSGAMHHSFAIFDATQLAIGSYRWNEAGENEDLSSMIFTSDPDAIKTYADRFESMWAGS